MGPGLRVQSRQEERFDSALSVIQSTLTHGALIKGSKIALDSK